MTVTLTETSLLLLSTLVVLASITGCAPASEDPAGEPAIADAPSARPADFGKRWVRSHPYTLMGLCINREPHNVEDYVAAGFNHMLAWRPWRPGVMEPTAAAGLTWFGHLEWVGQSKGVRPGLKHEYRKTAAMLTEKYPGNVGWILNDEPHGDEMELTGRAVEWVRRKYPDKLVLSNNFGRRARHVRNYLKRIKPDVMMFDRYPFSPKHEGWENPDGWFRCINAARQEALRANIPYWVFVQSFDGSGRKYFSESDLRVQLFVHLTYGFTGQAYFIYDYWKDQKAPCLVDADQKPTYIHRHTARANPEVLNVGKAIRFLTSTRVFAVPVGERIEPLVRRRILPVWTPKALAEDPIRSIRIVEPGRGRHGLIGYFKDDAGQRYFMLTNLWRRHGQRKGSAENTRLAFRVVLDPGIQSIYRLSRTSGEVEQLRIESPEDGLTLTLPGGTGDLFKIADGEFPGL